MRGEVLKVIFGFLSFGIIPAGAGRRYKAFGGAREGWDHPRGCGEKRRRRGGRQRAAGSSPRVRGEEQFKKSPKKAKGIIPAGAGRSGTTGHNEELRRDHPRGCGEK